MASSSSSYPTQQWKYDVFLSFRGEDTRNNFTSHLYTALCNKGIEVFIDNGLKRGEEISPALLKAIEESKISIIILSKNYAFSSWCLDELLKILECKNTNGQLVVPVFYHIDPSDVRNQTRSFAEAFTKHELKEELDKVHKWRAALRNVANLSGWHSEQHVRLESMLIDDIIKDILKKLYHISSSDFKGLVGIDSHIKQIESLLCVGLESACIVVGIWGMGGIGKTTIAKAIFNRISSQFNGCCFLANVREEAEKNGLVHLREKLLGKILMDGSLTIGIADLESTFIYERLGRKKVLIVLDDVNDLSQLQSIIGRLDQFGKGSRIVITTRNQQVLKNGVDEIYEVKELNCHEALQLFSLNAFKQNHPIEDFMELSKEVVNYAKGIPLALKVLGSFLFGRSKREWESALDKLKETPNLEIQKVLRISYDGLDQKEKDIFCDIACFFKGKKKDDVMKILDGCGFFADIGISVLIEKSLITISHNILCMHDLLQEMGLEVIREASKEPGERSRLWNHKDVCHVLTKKTGTKAVEGILLDMSKISKVYLSSKAFKRMCNLRIVKFYYPPVRASKRSNKLHFHEELVSLSDNLRYLHWERYPFKSLPPNYHPENLVELDLSYSNVKHLWKGAQPLFKLRQINLNNCKDLIKIPNFSNAPNLEHMYLNGCESLPKFHSSIQYLHKLIVLDLENCKKLTSLPSTIKLKSLVRLHLNNCSNLKEFPEISGNIEDLNLSGIPLEYLPSSIEYLFGISTQCLCFITALSLDNCNLSKIPGSLDNLSSLSTLRLGRNNFESIPESIKHLSRLTYLSIRFCKRLQSLPELPSCLTNIWADDCISLQTISISSTAVTGADEQEDTMRLRCSNCFKLDQDTCSKIVEDAQMKIQLMATASLKEGCYQGFTICFPGSEIPEWFSYSSRGFLINLPPHRGNSKLVGFALCAVVAFEDGYHNGPLAVECNMKTNNGKYGEIDCSSGFFGYGVILESEHIVLWYENCSNVRNDKEDDWFNNYCYNEPSFLFRPTDISKRWVQSCKVQKCGVHPLYAQDEDKCNPSMIQSRSPYENFGVIDEDFWEPMAIEGTSDYRCYYDEHKLDETESESGSSDEEEEDELDRTESESGSSDEEEEDELDGTESESGTSDEEEEDELDGTESESGSSDEEPHPKRLKGDLP